MQLPAPNKAEFVAYYLLYMAATFGNFKKKPDELQKVLRSAGPEVQASPFFSFALKMISAIGSSNWCAYFRLLRGAPLLLASAAALHLANMRSVALKALLFTGEKAPDPASATGRTTGVPLSRVAAELCFDSLEAAEQFARAHTVPECVSLRLAARGSELWVLRAVNPATRQLRGWTVPKQLPRNHESWLASKVPKGRILDSVTNPCAPPGPSLERPPAGAAGAGAGFAAWGGPPSAGASPLAPYSPLDDAAGAGAAVQAPGRLFAPPVPGPAARQQQQQQQQQIRATSSGILSKVTNFIFGSPQQQQPAQQAQQPAQQPAAPLQQHAQQPKPLAAAAATAAPDAPRLAFGSQAAAAPAAFDSTGALPQFGAAAANGVPPTVPQQQQQQQQQQQLPGGLPAATAPLDPRLVAAAAQAEAHRLAAQHIAAAQQAAVAAAAQAAALHAALEAERRRSAAAAAELEAVVRAQRERDAAAAAEAAEQEEERRKAGPFGLIGILLINLL
ncbi:hypothetical protein MNEG_15909 [Monoraphidium neglectum]|uniref:SAC3/GANP/THP3 conserved domain-containing protein n=1 Tax=Monoraphidium neglectum TaxID=145388 RepID=A0A0D2LJ95_9CHLO|nr:hypothetical protein MNEG_15909 [Monoraphidium neglectum]KIY92054.1 hypothetical protein MNEG_15909 [Monoraphidium neglectum]|eukprot:XP_013891074.1 hypothetical protein MNEG_15909 [Monoraphidium neglectum]